MGRFRLIQKLILTGYRGFVGSNLVSRLKSREIPFILYDFSIDAEVVAKQYGSNSIFIHLADPNSSTFSLQRSKEIERNLYKFAEIFESNFYYVSSSLVYCRDGNIPKKTSDSVCSESQYTDLKINRENMIQNFGGNILRIGNVYGLGMSAETIIGKISLSILKNSHFDSSYNPTRDFVYLEDILDAFVKLRELGSPKSKIYNIGSGVGTSVSELYELCANVLENKNDVKTTWNNVDFPDARLSLDKIVLDISSKNTLTGWKPKHSLEENIGPVINDLLERFDK